MVNRVEKNPKIQWKHNRLLQPDPFTEIISSTTDQDGSSQEHKEQANSFTYKIRNRSDEILQTQSSEQANHVTWTITQSLIMFKNNQLFPLVLRLNKMDRGLWRQLFKWCFQPDNSGPGFNVLPSIVFNKVDSDQIDFTSRSSFQE